MNRGAEKRSFDYCGETCPAVDRVASDFWTQFDSFVEHVKEVSVYKVRQALVEACSDLIAAEEEIEELKAQLKKKDDQIEDLRYEIRELDKEVSS